jgi:eukaryotic-like serine/threonine-protein kinase
MATVWCAEDGVLGRQVAIKLLADHFADDFLAVRRFKREARTSARVSEHPNIITIFDVGETAVSDRRERARPFIVMEHLAGGTVADALRAGEVSREDALKWIREASSALDYAHEHGVIHRDIKPANMLLDRGRSLHVGDFGIARIAHEDTITKGGQLFGTAAYLSPEQARGEPGTQASDRYALAVVAFELLTGERVFTGEHFAAQARAHLEDAPPAASEVNGLLPAAVDSVLTRGLAKAQDERWPTAGAFADALTSAMRGRRPTRTGPEREPIFVHRSEPISRRPRAVAIGALVAAMALAIVAAVVLATTDGGGSAGHRTASTRAVTHHRTAATTTHHAAQPRPAATTHHAAQPRPATHHPSAPATTSTPATTTQATSSPAPATTGAQTPTSAAPSAGTLEARGHSLLSAGSLDAAIPLLRQAVSAASPSSLTYAYALYDLGHALRLAGDPAAAVPVLEQRLRIPNQTAVVRAELDRALAELGHRSGPAAPASPKPSHGHAHGRPSGGAAPGRAKP